MDPESVLAEAMEDSAENEVPVPESTESVEGAEMSPVPPQDAPVINFDGFLTERQPPLVSKTVDNLMPASLVTSPEMESVEKSNVPVSEKSWADVVDLTVPPVGPSQHSVRPKSAPPLPQRVKPAGREPATIPKLTDQLARKPTQQTKVSTRQKQKDTPGETPSETMDTSYGTRKCKLSEENSDDNPPKPS